MKKLLWLVTAMFIFFSFQTIYAASNNDIEFIPSPKINSTEETRCNEYPNVNYMFDTEDFGILEVIAPCFQAIANGIFFLIVLMSKLTNFLLVEAFEMNIFSYIGNIFDSIIIALRDAAYNPLLDIVLPITGLSVFFYVILNKGTRAVNYFVQVIIILGLAAGFMAKPSFMISMVNDMAREVSQSLLGGTASVVNSQKISGSDAVANLSNVYWDTTVEKPWQIIEFGKVVDNEKADEYLSKSPGSEERKNIAEKEDNFLFKKFGQIIRIAMVIFILLIDLVMSIMVVVLAGLMFLTQFAAIIASVVAILGFIIALLPNMGLRVATHAIYNILEFLLARLAITLLLCIYFVIASILYKSSVEIGWFFSMLLQVFLIATIVLYRKKIFGFVKAVAKGQGAAQSAMDRKPEVKRTMYKANKAKRMYNDMQNIKEHRKDIKLNKKYKPIAEKYLHKRYDEEKRISEVKARKTGKPVEYTDFVKKADQRVEKGFAAFSSAEISTTTNMMKNLHKQGEKPDQLLMTKVSGKSNDQIRKDQQGLENRINRTKEMLKKKEDSNQKAIDRVIRTDTDSEFYSRRRVVLERLKGLGTNLNDTEEYFIDAPNENNDINNDNQQIAKITTDGSVANTQQNEQFKNTKKEKDKKEDINKKNINNQNIKVPKRGLNKENLVNNKIISRESDISNIKNTSNNLKEQDKKNVNHIKKTNDTISKSKETNIKDKEQITKQTTNVQKSTHKKQIEKTEDITKINVNKTEYNTNNNQNIKEVRVSKENMINNKVVNKKNNVNNIKETSNNLINNIEKTKDTIVKTKEINNADIKEIKHDQIYNQTIDNTKNVKSKELSSNKKL